MMPSLESIAVMGYRAFTTGEPCPFTSYASDFQHAWATGYVIAAQDHLYPPLNDILRWALAIAEPAGSA